MAKKSTRDVLLTQRLKNWRKATGLPLKSVAADIGVSVSTLSSWEKGTRFPSLPYLQRISEHTGIPICAFFHACVNRRCPHLNGDLK